MLSLTPTFAAFSNGVVGRSAVAQRSGAMTMGVESLVGASEEISGKVWDPLNLSANMDEGNLNLVRAAELKHCRVAMLATVGWCWTATGTHFEGMLSTSAGISFASLAQLDPLTAASKVPAAGIWQMIVAIGCLEVTALGRPNPPVSRTPNPPGAPLAPSRTPPPERLQPPPPRSASARAPQVPSRTLTLALTLHPTLTRCTGRTSSRRTSAAATTACRRAHRTRRSSASCSWRS